MLFYLLTGDESLRRRGGGAGRGADQRGPLAVPVFLDKLDRPGFGRRLGHGFRHGQLHRTLRPAPQAAAKKQKQWHRQKRRNAILMAAGDKRGANEDSFYRNRIRPVDSRFAGHVAT